MTGPKVFRPEYYSRIQEFEVSAWRRAGMREVGEIPRRGAQRLQAWLALEGRAAANSRKLPAGRNLLALSRRPV